ncbi:polysaccharide lyase family 1 protein [Pontibacter silvestris]|uniref:Polysaccharide lyase family 1 protein n=1 Tax=Pontibacter silvestris TaxID=2305183 RepID=A0ABW4WU06_9BACT|nr:pectate lyase [Pontibacter silvestris]MCC9137247.1 pectate lyase [Pontibacter silvestris]
MNIKGVVTRAILLCLGAQVVVFSGCAQQQPSGVSISQEPEDKQPLAFPGAEGFGKYTTGGRGGEVYTVTNLNDSGPGSLREAIWKKGPRTIVFAVSGTIDLEAPLDINNGDITIAGQSAPGDGVCLRNYPVSVKADNVIIRYMRFRLGDKKAQEADAIGGTKGKSNIIIDHCSMSWATDEGASFYSNKNFTLQWCIIAESLNQSVHHKGDHGYGGIWGGEGATFHHNLLANHNSRNPRFSGSSSTTNSADELVDFRNNVIFNWKNNSIYGGEKGRYNLVNNYLKPGPATLESKRDRILEPYAPYGQFYVAGNYIDGFANISDDNWDGGIQCEHPDSVKAEHPFSVVAIKDHEPGRAYELVLAQAGASYKRDAADARVVNEVRSGKPSSGKEGNGIIDSQGDVGGWPELKSLPVPADADSDGMPDAWEKKHQLNTKDKSDAAAYTLDDQYTNIEVYLNSLVSPKGLQ